jgi:5'-3' exonuclease
MKYLEIDLANTFFRARHAAHRGSTIEERVAFSIHVTLASIAKCWRDQKGNHVVICLEGRSWRKSFYAPYKRNRSEARAASTEKEQEEDKLFFAAFEELQNFFLNKSNCTVLQHPNLEADDLIGGFIQLHPDDEHVIISSDSDYYQLLASNVSQYNGISDELHTIKGILDRKGKYVIDKKTKLPKTIPDPSWILFEKCMRGDSTDNVFSAYPGVRTKGTKNKTGLQEAYEDRNKKGYAWNNLMLQRWVDPDGKEHLVLDDYNRNVTLVDLTAQPDDVKVQIVETITEKSKPKAVPQIGLLFMKFCGKHELNRLADNPDNCVNFLAASYPE